MDAPAIPEVIVEEIPASRSAPANMIPALFPTNGTNSCCAWSNSSTAIFCLKKVAAASIIMAELIAQPITIDNSVS